MTTNGNFVVNVVLLLVTKIAESKTNKYNIYTSKSSKKARVWEFNTIKFFYGSDERDLHMARY